MNYKIAYNLFGSPLFFACGVILYGCVKNPVIPTITTVAVYDITATSALSGGIVTSNGGAEVTVRGVCWSSTHQNPTVTDINTSDSTGSGTFSSNITGLTPNNTYNVRSYATNSAGTAYGNKIAFTTNQIIVVPTLTTIALTDITSTSAISGGYIDSDGGAKITDWGVCLSTSEYPTTNNYRYDMTSGKGVTGIFKCTLIDLISSTTFFIRAYAINSAGTAYGNQISFTTTY